MNGVCLANLLIHEDVVAKRTLSQLLRVSSIDSYCTILRLTRVPFSTTQLLC